jgi:recombination DNA repair RAD52 pathway protein
MFHDDINRRLEKPLDEKLVLKRFDDLDYITGQVAIQHANAIFGYGNWGYGVKDIRRDGMYVHAIVWVEVFNNDGHTSMIHREDVGTGKIEMTKEKKDKQGNVIKEPEELQEMGVQGCCYRRIEKSIENIRNTIWFRFV